MTVDDDELELVIDAAWIRGALGVEERTADDGRTLVIASFDDATAAEELADRWSGTTDEAASDAGLDAWREYAEPIETEHWRVVPEWLATDADHGSPSTIVADPGRGFSAGTHASTRLALDAIHSIDLGIGDAVVLDLGSGSGVLGIAASRRGAGSVVPVDIDPEAITATDHNVAISRCRSELDPAWSIQPATTTVPELSFDIVLANVLLADLETLASVIDDRLADSGALVTTGHLVEQRHRVVALFEQLTVTEQWELDGWSLLVLRRR